MSKKVKIRVILFFITAALSVCAAIGIVITEILFLCEIIGLLPIKVCMTTSVVLAYLAAFQAYPLLKLPTTN